MKDLIDFIKQIFRWSVKWSAISIGLLICIGLAIAGVVWANRYITYELPQSNVKISVEWYNNSCARTAPSTRGMFDDLIAKAKNPFVDLPLREDLFSGVDVNLIPKDKKKPDTKLSEFRKKYPQYNDMSDQALADALHRKFYSSIPKDDYYRRIGLSAPQEDVPLKPWERNWELYPAQVTIYNGSNRVINKTYFSLMAKRQGFSEVVSGGTSGDTDKILNPGESYSLCYRVRGKNPNQNSPDYWLTDPGLIVEIAGYSVTFAE